MLVKLTLMWLSFCRNAALYSDSCRFICLPAFFFSTATARSLRACKQNIQLIGKMYVIS